MQSGNYYVVNDRDTGGNTTSGTEKRECGYFQVSTFLLPVCLQSYTEGPEFKSSFGLAHRLVEVNRNCFRNFLRPRGFDSWANDRLYAQKFRNPFNNFECSSQTPITI